MICDDWLSAADDGNKVYVHILSLKPWTNVFKYYIHMHENAFAIQAVAIHYTLGS